MKTASLWAHRLAVRSIPKRPYIREATFSQFTSLSRKFVR